MGSKRSVPVAVYRVLPGSPLDGADWVRGGDRWLADRLSPVGRYFPRTPAMRRGVFTIRWVEDQWVVAHAITEPPRQNVVLRVARVEANALWSWIIPLWRCLGPIEPQPLEGMSAVDIRQRPDMDAALTLRHILGLLSMWGRLGQQRSFPSTFFMKQAISGDASLRMAAAVSQFLECRSSTAVLSESSREPEERDFINLGWRAFFSSRSVEADAAGAEIVPYDGLVRGVRVVDLLPGAQSTLDRLFDCWDLESASKSWEQRIQVPAALIPANLLSEDEWERRLTEYLVDRSRATGRTWDYDCLCKASPPQVQRYIQLCNLEAELGLERTIRNRVLTEKCKITIDQIRAES